MSGIVLVASLSAKRRVDARRLETRGGSKSEDEGSKRKQPPTPDRAFIPYIYIHTRSRPGLSASQRVEFNELTTSSLPRNTTRIYTYRLCAAQCLVEARDGRRPRGEKESRADTEGRMSAVSIGVQQYACVNAYTQIYRA